VPLREDLLTPIPGDNPAGVNLRYDRVYDQIKEARSEEDVTLPAGAWERQTKRADFKLVAKLAGDALVGRTKDLQLAVWLGEAMIKQEGISLLAPALRLCLELQQYFGDTLYPEIDEGDPGMRVVPLQWAANRYATLVYGAELTKQPINFFEYKAARIVGREEDANSNAQQRVLREQAISNGKLTSEAVDEAIAATPKSFYVEFESLLHSAGEVLQELDLHCEEHYGDDAPSFRKLREAIEEVQNLVSSLLRDKRRLDPDLIEEVPDRDVEKESHASAAAPLNILAIVPSQEQVRTEQTLPSRADAIPREQRRLVEGQQATLESWNDALECIEGAVVYMHEQEPSSPLPFLLRSSVRLAELRTIFANFQFGDLAAPPTELRQSLKGAASSGDLLEVHRQGFAALGAPCGRGWLDLYRYLWTSCRGLGWEAQQRSIANVVQQMLREIPQLAGWTLNDDTPAANADTVRWLTEEIAAISAPESQENEELTAASSVIAMSEAILADDSGSPLMVGGEDLFATAQALTSKGQVQRAIQLLSRDAAHQPVGRLRYGRNLEIAELCLQSGNSTVAVPVLQGLIREVEERRLESWEPHGTVVRPYVLLLQCAPMAKLDTKSIFARLCAIDPSTALAMTPPAES
jgi:type VI secretion system protein ImpA